MKNRYFLKGKIYDEKLDKTLRFSYRQLTDDTATASNVEGIMYETKGGIAIETDAYYKFTERQKITCNDGRVMIITSVSYNTRTLNTPASRYAKAKRVATIILS